MSASRAIMTPSRTDFAANLASPRSLKEDVEQFLYRLDHQFGIEFEIELPFFSFFCRSRTEVGKTRKTQRTAEAAIRLGITVFSDFVPAE